MNKSDLLETHNMLMGVLMVNHGDNLNKTFVEYHNQIKKLISEMDE